MTILLEVRSFVGTDHLEEWCFSQTTHQGQRGGAWEAAEGSVLFFGFYQGGKLLVRRGRWDTR